VHQAVVVLHVILRREGALLWVLVQTVGVVAIEVARAEVCDELRHVLVVRVGVRPLLLADEAPVVLCLHVREELSLSVEVLVAELALGVPLEAGLGQRALGVPDRHVALQLLLRVQELLVGEHLAALQTHAAELLSVRLQRVPLEGRHGGQALPALPALHRAAALHLPEGYRVVEEDPGCLEEPQLPRTRPGVHLADATRWEGRGELTHVPRGEHGLGLHLAQAAPAVPQDGP